MNRSLVRLILVGLSLIGLSTALGRNAETDSANESVLRAANTRSEQRQTEVRTCATKDVPETVADQIDSPSSDSSRFEFCFYQTLPGGRSRNEPVLVFRV
jgi:hypothetical protein